MIRRLRKKRVAWVSLVIICALIILSIFAPMLNEYTFIQQHVHLANMPPRIPGVSRLGVANGRRLLQNRREENVRNPELFNPDAIIRIQNRRYVADIAMVDVLVDYYVYKNAADVYFWFGSDYLGRDLFTRLFRGARVSLMIAFLAVLINLIIGVVYGAAMGYYGGKLDMGLMRLMEILDGIPYLVVVILFMLMLGTGMRAIVLALCVTGWISVARLVRAQFYRYKVREYVLAAKTQGVPDMRMIFRHILPNTVGPVITQTMLAVPGAIFAESFLAFIGLGIQAPEPSIGVLLADGQRWLTQFPYQTLIPAALISLLMISFNLLANGLRDVMDPMD